MSHHDDQHVTLPVDQARSAISETERLFERYGADLAGDALDDEAKKELLVALWRIMQGMVDLGFNVGRGEKFVSGSDLGMDDVLNYIIVEDTEHETDASPNNNREHS